MTLNLKDPRARAIVERLVADYDILIEQFRPGVMAKQIGRPIRYSATPPE